MIEEVAHERVDALHGWIAALGGEAALDHPARPAADQLARGIIADRGQSLVAKDRVERGDEIGRRVDQRPIKIEDDGRASHDSQRSLAGRRLASPDLTRRGGRTTLERCGLARFASRAGDHDGR